MLPLRLGFIVFLVIWSTCQDLSLSMFFFVITGIYHLSCLGCFHLPKSFIGALINKLWKPSPWKIWKLTCTTNFRPWVIWPQVSEFVLLFFHSKKCIYNADCKHMKIKNQRILTNQMTSWRKCPNSGGDHGIGIHFWDQSFAVTSIPFACILIFPKNIIYY